MHDLQQSVGNEPTKVSEIVRPALPRGVACGCFCTAGSTAWLSKNNKLQKETVLSVVS